MLSLIMCVTGGIDWGDVAAAVYEIDVYEGLLPFLAFILFTLLTFMNVITGVFLELASDRAKDERDIFLMGNAAKIFQVADPEGSGQITWPDFERIMTHDSMFKFFSAIDLDVTDAETLFDLLDFSGDGAISADEFFCGCLRLRGAAKSLDLLVLSREVHTLCQANKKATIQKSSELMQAIVGNVQSIDENTEAIECVQETNLQILEALKHRHSIKDHTSSLPIHALRP